MNNKFLTSIAGCFCIPLLFLAVLPSFAQQRFTRQGEIEFEKRVNMHAFIRAAMSRNDDNGGYMQRMYDQFKTSQPQFKTSKSILKFSGETTLYTPVTDEGTQSNNYFYSLPGVEQINTIQSDLAHRTSTIQKTVFEEVFLIKDSIRNITWKITDETREIAGYPCRRANAVIMDSIYVVAFYTDKILTSGGPESFTGLPGMILGVALPHDHVTWFATKVIDVPVAVATLKAPVKGKKVDQDGFKETLTEVFKKWGDYAKPYLRFLLL